MLCLYSSVFAQRLTPQFGVLTEVDKYLKSIESEPDAAAIVLFDIGESYFHDSDDGGFEIRFTRMRRVKVLSRVGYQEATVSIPFYFESPTKKEVVRSIEAHTYNVKDGFAYKQTLDPGSVFEEQVSKFWRVKKFTFPDVQVGAIIEYRYVLETPFHFNLPDWEFQGKIPVLYSEYTVNMIPFYEYQFIAQGITKFDYQNSSVSKKKREWGASSDAKITKGSGVEYNDMIHTYAMKDVPSFPDEALVTSPKDYVMKMDLQLSRIKRPFAGTEEVMTTWPLLIKALMDHERFGKFMKASDRFAKKLLESEIQLGDAQGDKKVEVLVNYVRNNFSWDKINDNYAHKTAKEFFEQRSGHSGEINLFLVALLNAAGITADPVLISTRTNGKIKTDYPFDHYFNSVVVLVKSPQRSYLTDGTEPLLAYDRIPPRCINEQGLVVSEAAVTWVSLEPRMPSIDEKILSYRIDPGSRTASVTGQIQCTEYQSLSRKDQFRNDSIAFRKHLKEFHHVEPVETRMYSYDRPRVPYVIRFKGTLSLEFIDNNLVLQPLLSFPMNENPLRQVERTYPVDFTYAQSSKIKATVTIPDGYAVAQTPEPIQIDDDLAQINFRHTLAGGELQIQADYFLKKGVYPSSEYERLKTHLGKIANSFNAPVVLQKK
jgi:transglutaminase-like putative cysteine protease